MSNSDRPKPVQIVPIQSNDDPAVERARRITELALSMDEHHAFQKGQLVRWKAGLKNRSLPGYNEPVVVRDVLRDPVFETCDASRCASTPFFGEPLTLVLGLIDPEGDFSEFRYDGRRFEPYDVSL